MELRQAGDANRNFFFSLASALNQNYFYQTCQPVGSQVHPHVADIVVDTATLEQNVRLLLSGLKLGISQYSST